MTPPEGMVLNEAMSQPPRTEIYELDGIGWTDAPMPPYSHTCWAQTLAWMDYFTQVRRCPCGAISIAPYGWAEKNQGRKDDTVSEGDSLVQSGSILIRLCERILDVIRQRST